MTMTQGVAMRLIDAKSAANLRRARGALLTAVPMVHWHALHRHLGGMDACMETSSGKHCCQPQSLLPVTPSPAVCAGGLTHQLYWSLPTEWSWYGFTEMVCTPP